MNYLPDLPDPVLGPSRRRRRGYYGSGSCTRLTGRRRHRYRCPRTGSGSADNGSSILILCHCLGLSAEAFNRGRLAV